MHWISLPRSRLLAHFKDDTPLTFVYGPPGSGKTLLLKEWARAQQGIVAWLTCSDADNDPLHLWQHLIYAFDPTINSASFVASPFPSNLEASVVALTTWIEARQHPIHLVIDDFHLVQAADARWILPYFLQRRPMNLRATITSRFRDVALPLHRWELTEQLSVVTPADLAFTLDETRQVVHAVSDQYTEADIQTLQGYTNGWIMGVKLALMRKNKEFTQDADLLHDPRQLANYLCEEVFQALPADYRTFVIQTSVLDVLTADICRVLTENVQSPILLETLADYGLVVPVEGNIQAFRYLDFWKDFLSRLPEKRDALHHRAALWYRAANDIDQAISHALRGEKALAADLIRQHGRSKIARGELLTLRRWITQLPESLVQTDGELCMLYAWALVHAGEIDQAERYLHHSAHDPGEVNTLRARMAAFRGDRQEMIRTSQRALQDVPATAFSLRADLLLNLGCAYLELGRAMEARSTLIEVLRLSRTARQPRAEIFAKYFLGKVSMAQGRMQQALRHYQDGLRAHGKIPIAGLLHVGIAEISYEHNDLDNARQHLEEALQAGALGGELKPLVYANIALGLLLSPPEAIERLERLTDLSDWPLLYAWQTLWWLRAGNTSMAAYWLEDTLTHSEYISEFERMVQVRILLTLGRWEEAKQLLDVLQTKALEQQRYGDLIHLLLLQAQRHQAQGQWNEALQCVAQAAERGEGEGYIRAFLDEGEALSRLYRRLASQRPDNRYLKQIVRQLPAPAPQLVSLPFGETLSQREVEVLHLVAAGASNEEIADKLFLTTGTVKWHVHNIFGKLAAKNRTQAVQRAREVGLLAV